MKKTEFYIGSHFLPYIFNGEPTGLLDSEIELFNEFEQSIISHENGRHSHWSFDGEILEFAQCEVTNLHGQAAKVYRITI